MYDAEDIPEVHVDGFLLSGDRASSSISRMFSTFLSNLSVQNREIISLRYGELTSALNQAFRDTDSKTANSLQVGSFGRSTAIKGVSDLDLLYIMPASKWEEYEDGKQLKLLQDVKGAILKRYSTTKVRVDRLVVTVTYSDFHMEVQPVFEQEDGSFKYPDTKNGGSWKVTKPRLEMDAVSKLDKEKNQNLRRLCKMGRAWKNQHGVPIGGLLLDTLAYNFLSLTTAFDSTNFGSCGQMAHDFFEFLSKEPKQERYAAPGSAQHVKVKAPFQRKAEKARKLAEKALASGSDASANKKWKKVFGREFPAAEKSAVALKNDSRTGWRNTEEFIEDAYPVDIRHHVAIDCDVVQSGFRPDSLRRMIQSKYRLFRGNQLTFRVTSLDVSPPYEVKWKVLNRGDEARRRDEIRGEILADSGNEQKTEHTSFAGDHVVDCYIIKDGVVVAKDRIHVPIQ